MMTACTTPVTDGMKVECDTAELKDLRKQIIELLFVEGNHYCPACEKSETANSRHLDTVLACWFPVIPISSRHGISMLPIPS